MQNKRKSKSDISAVMITLAGFALLLIFVIVMLNNAAETSWKEARQAAEDSVIRAVVSCYAYEGVYPDNIEYLIENYNLVIDEQKYLIHYEKMADNLMPNIIIMDRGKRMLYETQL